MPKHVAVIADASASGFFFPKWHAYYAACFGAMNLYVVTYQGLSNEFSGFKLGGLWEVPHRYADSIRAKLISALVSALLTTHDLVVRCDVDEFLVPDPRKFASLAEYTEQLTLPYVTARGVDIIEDPSEAALDFQSPILRAQRKIAIRMSAINKTCITGIPLYWSEGFHGANVPPAFDDIYLIHLKFADIKARVVWFNHMRDSVADGGQETAYFSPDLRWMLGHRDWLLRRERTDGWCALTSDGFDERFLSTVVRNPQNGIYAGEFFEGRTIFDIPSEFTNLL